MKINRTLSQIEIDKGVGKEIEKKLLNAKDRIIVISPWISKRYISILHKKTHEIKDLRIFTYENEENYYSINPFVEKKLHLKEFVLNGILTLVSFSLFIYLLLYFLESYKFIFLILSILVFISFLLFFINLKESYTIQCNMNIIIQSENDENFLHLKAYLIDKELYISSANLTENGMSKNIESMVRFDDNIVIEEFLRYADHLTKKVNMIPLENFIKKYSIKTKFFGFIR